MNERRELLKSLAAASGVALLPRALRAAAPVAAGIPLHARRGFRLSGRPFRDAVDTPRAARRSARRRHAATGHAAALRGCRRREFRRIVTRGKSTAEARFAHSVHQPVNGLEPARDYWYRFIAGDHVSAVGRTRTLPAARARVD